MAMASSYPDGLIHLSLEFRHLLLVVWWLGTARPRHERGKLAAWSCSSSVRFVAART